jgi:hypothetical protein
VLLFSLNHVKRSTKKPQPLRISIGSQGEEVVSFIQLERRDRNMTMVGPKTETQVTVVYDTDTRGFGGPPDMDGPEIGRVLYSQPGDNLQLQISLEFALPNTRYEVFLVCGPAHALSCGFRAIGILTTNAAGAGATSITVPFAVLEVSPFGPGYRTDHIDLLRGLGNADAGVLTAGAINYFVCRKEGIHGLEQAESTTATSGLGDPMGTLARSSDPMGAHDDIPTRAGERPKGTAASSLNAEVPIDDIATRAGERTIKEEK